MQIRTKGKSGTLCNVGHRSVIAKHIGNGKDEVEVTVLRPRAFEWIEEQTAQLSLFPSQKQKVLVTQSGFPLLYQVFAGNTFYLKDFS